MIYYLNAIHIDTASGVAKASVNVSTKDQLTGTPGGFDRAITPIGPAAQAKLDAICADAIAYIQQKHPGVVLTMPPIQPVSE